MNIIYMGTPKFAVNALDALIASGKHEVVACFTQPDKPKGRGRSMQPTPVKITAFEHGIPVHQPVKLSEPENVELIMEYEPDVIVVAAYGQILPENILKIPKYGCINIHASLLPKYRGAAPIARAIIDGQTETGVTTMYMEKGLDTGDIIEQERVVIESDDTTETLTERLAVCGARLILSTLDMIKSETAVRTPQNDDESCYASMLTKEMGDIDWNEPAAKIERLVRGLIPWPCAYTSINGKNAKLYAARSVTADEVNVPYEEYKPGQIAYVTKKKFAVVCGDGLLEITRLQLEGKKPMDTAAFLAGNRLEPGMQL